MATSDTLTSMMRTFIKQGRTPDEAADMALDRATKGKLRDAVRPLMVAQARRLAREVVRRTEDTVPLRPSGSITTPDAMRKLLSSTFVLPDGERVAWGEATAEQHRRRAQMYEDIAGHNLARAAAHVEAAERLERTGATNLAALLQRDEIKELAA